MWEPPQRLVHESLLASAEAVPDRDAIVDELSTETYAGFAHRALRLARFLQDEGLQRGDRVAIYLDNTTECASAVFGTWLAGGVVTIVHPQTKAEKLALILSDSEPSIFLSEGRLASIAGDAIARATTEPHYLSTPDLRQAIAATEPEPRPAGTIPPDLAVLAYTSGTTGHPKGVMLSHEALVFTVGSIIEYLQLVEEDRMLNILPLANTYGLSNLLVMIRLGGTFLLERSFAFPARTIERMESERPTIFPAVPTVYATLVGMSTAPMFDSVRVLTNAAAGLPPALHAGIRRLFPNARLYRMYGQTECVRVCFLSPELLDDKPTSVGRAIPGTEVFVLGDDGREVVPGEVGILHVRGPHLMLGYWNDPGATAQVLKDGPYPGERMLCTRDHFTTDEDGLLYFVGRTDDIIKTRGEKVSVVEVENVLHTMDGVRQAAVVGVLDEILGQALRAYVVLEEGAALNELEILRFARSRLENFMVPREILLLDELPHTESGKVLKRTLLERQIPPRGR
jgi:long-chain acyl-CoA synthetase